MCPGALGLDGAASRWWLVPVCICACMVQHIYIIVAVNALAVTLCHSVLLIVCCWYVCRSWAKFSLLK